MSNTPPIIEPANQFGTDLWTAPDADGVLDIDPAGRMVSGRVVLSQRLIKRQTTPRGTVIDVPNECFDIRGFLSGGFTQTQLQTVAGNIKAELLRDEGVTSATVQAVYDTITKTLTVVENIESGYGPFKLTLTVTQLTVQVLLADQGT